MYKFGVALIAGLLSVGTATAQSVPTWSSTPDESAFRVSSPRLTPVEDGNNPAPTTGLSSGSVLDRDPRIDAMAGALDNDVDRIYEYVRNHIHTTPTFGATKGAFGAMLDGYGTAFDQADLMVQLVRAAGGTANYAYGNITLSAAEFESFFGPATLRGACELLASAGIPASINGVTSANCASNSYNGTLTGTITMRHMWVEAQVGGSTHVFDPSLKPIIRSDANVAVINEAPSASTIRQSASATSAATGLSGVDALTGYDSAAIDTTLAAATSQIRSTLIAQEAGTQSAFGGTETVATHTPLSMAEVVGGVVGIERDLLFHSDFAPRLTAHPNLDEQYSTFAEIPNELRTVIAIAVEFLGTRAEFARYGQEIAGRRLMVSTESWLFDDPEDVQMRLYVDEEEVASARYSGTQASAVSGVPMTVRVSVDHPYFGGAPMASSLDAQYAWPVSNTATSFVMLSLGERGNGAELRNTQAIAGSGLTSWNNGMPCTPGPDGCSVPNYSYWYSTGNANTLMAAGEGFLSNAARLQDIYAGLSTGRRVAHHLAGVASVNTQINTDNGTQGGTQMYLSMSGQAGFAQYETTARSRESFALASGSALAALEQAVIRSNADATHVNGTASMFDWFADASVTEAYTATEDQEHPALQIRLLEFESAGASNADTLVWSGPIDASSYTGGSYSSAGSLGNDYLSAGYTLVAPQSDHIGPVRDGLRLADEFSAGSCSSACTIEDFDVENTYRTRHQAFFAYQIDANGNVFVAPVANGRYKGGGAGSFPEELEPPSIDQEAIDEAYETWATSFDVDLRTGGLTLTPPADLTTGAGGYPYSLGFQRTYSSDRGSDGPLGWGWTHNFDTQLTISSDVGAAMGDQTPHQALATIIAAEATLDLFETAGSELSRDAVTVMLVQNWWADQVFDNQVNITRGTGGERFVRQPDGVWEPEPGSNSQLSMSGSRIQEAKISNYDPTPGTEDAPPSRTISSAWNRSGLSFTHTSADGTVESFTYGVDRTRSAYTPELSSGYHDSWSIGSGSTFLRRSTTLSTGLVVDYTWSSASGSIYAGETLSRVSVGAPFNREINFTYEANPNVIATLHDEEAMPNAAGHTGPAVRLASIDDGQGRSVSFDYDGTGAQSLRQSSTLTSVTNLMGDTTQYRYTDIAYPLVGSVPPPTGVLNARVRISEIRLPHDLSDVFLSFGWDSEGRASTVTNSRGKVWTFLAGEQARGRQIDPLGWDSHEYYDENGRMFASVAPRGERTISALDALGRTIASQTSWDFWSLDRTWVRTAAFYDAYGNGVLEQDLGGTNNSGVPLATDPLETITRFEYAQYPTLPTRTIDPRGNVSLTCYHATQSGCSGVAGGTHDGLIRAQYGPSGEEQSFAYTSYGRVSSDTVRVSASEVRTTTRTYSSSNGLPTLVRLEGPTNAQDLETSFEWDSYGNLERVTDPEGREAHANYRADRRITRIVGANQSPADASVSEFDYDASGRIIASRSATDVSGTADSYVVASGDWATTNAVYSEWGRLESISDPAGDLTNFGYYDNDLVQHVTDATDRRTNYNYLPGGLRSCVRQYEVGQPASEWRTERSVRYSVTGEARRWWNGNFTDGCSNDSAYRDFHTTDPYYRQNGHEFPDGSMEGIIFDAAGNMEYFNNRAGQGVDFSYDASNRLTLETHTASRSAYSYDLTGARTQSQEDGNTSGAYDQVVDLDYDFAGRLVSETHTRNQLSGDPSFAVSYEYDDSGNRTAIEWPDGYVARYAYDGASRLTSVCEDADGNGTCELTLASYQYDHQGRRVRTWFGGTSSADAVSAMGMFYEIDGDLARIEHDFEIGTANERTVAFAHGYDAAGRLATTEVSENGWLWSAGSLAFVRDYNNDVETQGTSSLGQMDGWTDTGGSSASISYTYDANGNMVSSGTRFTTHDSRNRLTAYAGATFNTVTGLPTGASATSNIRYDANGRRVYLSSTNQVDLAFIHAGDMEIADLDVEGGTYNGVLRRYIPGAAVDERVAMIEVNPSTGAVTGREYYHVNRQGSVIAMVEATDGSIEAQYVYTPFGVESPFNASANPFRYTGRRFDAQWGVYYYRARYYDPVIGRFLEVDPAWYRDSLNLYTYVANNPLNATDPTGAQSNQPASDSVEGEVVETITHANSAGEAVHRAQGDFRQAARFARANTAIDVASTLGETVRDVGGGENPAAAAVNNGIELGTRLMGASAGGSLGGALGKKVAGTPGAAIGMIGGGIAGAMVVDQIVGEVDANAVRQQMQANLEANTAAIGDAVLDATAAPIVEAFEGEGASSFLDVFRQNSTGSDNCAIGCE